MKWQSPWRGLALAACVLALRGEFAAAQAPPSGREPMPAGLQQPVYRVAALQEAEEEPELLRKFPNHPLAPVLRWGYSSIQVARAIDDYTATMVKRERLDGKLGEPQYMFVKVRHRPFSVYTYFLAPANLKGQEAIYVEGQNENKVIAHAPPNSLLGRTVGMVKVRPDSAIAMKGNKYPITNLGILHLVEEIVRTVEDDIAFEESEVKFFEGAKINGNVCTCIQITHPVPRQNFRYHVARIFVDDKLNLPIRFEGYTWPQREGDAPELIEEYTYLNLKLNVGLTDRDFDPNNPEYNYR